MLRMEPFPIAELAHDVAVKFMPEAKRRGVRLDVHVTDDLPSVIADIWLVERVLSNLIDNALRATPAGGTVDLDVQRSGAGVAVAVIDTGCGIEPDELALVTQRFYRTRRSQSEAGSGLGLAIAKDILARHDAQLEIDSRIGCGTVVRFVLAAARSQPEPHLQRGDNLAKNAG
jgi:signal transduction histidine kinase